jgi:hypothetical protein
VEFLANVFQGKNVGDGIFVEPYVTVVDDMGLHFGGKRTAVPVDCHRVFGSPYTGYQLTVAKQINRRLVVKKNHVAQLHLI